MPFLKNARLSSGDQMPGSSLKNRVETAVFQAIQTREGP